MDISLSERIKLRSLFCIVMAIIAFMDSSAMYNEYFLGKIFTYALKAFCLIMIPFLLQKFDGWNKLYLFFGVIPLAWGVIDENSLLLTLQYFYSAGIPLMVFALLKNNEQETITKYYLKIFKIFCYIGIPFYIILNITILPHTVLVRSHDHRQYYNYFWLYFTHGYGYIQARFCSIFDEPGVVGTFIGIILLYYKKYIRKKTYIVFCILGIMTFSLFFIITFFPITYFSDLRYIKLIDKIKKIFIFIAILILGYLFLNIAGRYTKGKGVYEVMVYNRFEWKDNWIVGIVNNRDASVKGFDKAYEEFFNLKNKYLWLGHGKFAVRKDFGGSGLSYRIYIYEKGLLSVIYIALFFIFLHDWQRKNLLFNFVSIAFLTALFFQRPYLYSLPFFILIYAGIRIVPKYVGGLKDKYYGII